MSAHAGPMLWWRGVSLHVADPVRKIKTIAMKDMARQALGWPAQAGTNDTRAVHA
nr:hypothetical protein [Mesorhizobium sp.]